MLLHSKQSNYSVQLSSVIQLCLMFCDPKDCSAPGFPIHHQLPGLLKLMSIESVMPSNHLILCGPLLFLPSILPSIRVFSNESVLALAGQSFSISFLNKYSRLMFFRISWFDPLIVQRTLQSLLQHHSSKTSIIQPSPFFIAQLSQPHVTTGKTIALTRWTFVGKVMHYYMH